MENPFDKNTFKYDFLEILNARFLKNEFHLHEVIYITPNTLAEIAECIMIASIHGNVYEENKNGKEIKSGICPACHNKTQLIPCRICYSKSPETTI